MAELIHTLGIDWKLLAANTITFFIVLWILRRFAYRPIINLLEQRQRTVADGLTKAKQSQEGYAELQREKQRIVEEAKTDALKLVHAAEVEASNLRQQELVKTQTEASQLLAKTKQQLERERQQMVSKAKADLAGLVVTASAKVLGETVDAELEKKLQAQAVKAVKSI